MSPRMFGLLLTRVDAVHIRVVGLQYCLEGSIPLAYLVYL